MRALAGLGYGGAGKWGDQRPGEFVSSWEGQPEAALAKRGSQTPLEWIAREIRCITVEGKNSRLGLGLYSLSNTGGSRGTTERGRSTHSPEFSIWTTSRSPCPLCEVFARSFTAKRCFSLTFQSGLDPPGCSPRGPPRRHCLLYTSDAADERK